MKGLSNALAVALTIISQVVYSQDAGDIAFMNSTVDAARVACGGKGSSVDLRVKGSGSAESGRVIAQMIGAGARVSGEAEFSKAEWDGIESMRKEPARYAECVQKLIPMFLDRFKKKGS